MVAGIDIISQGRNRITVFNTFILFMREIERKYILIVAVNHKGRRQLARSVLYGQSILKWILNIRIRGFVLDSFGPG